MNSVDQSRAYGRLTGIGWSMRLCCDVEMSRMSRQPRRSCGTGSVRICVRPAGLLALLPAHVAPLLRALRLLTGEELSTLIRQDLPESAGCGRWRIVRRVMSRVCMTLDFPARSGLCQWGGYEFDRAARP